MHNSLTLFSNISAITADLDASSYSLTFPDDGSRLVFKGKTASGQEYAADLELFEPVLGDKAKISLTGKSLFIRVPKKGMLELSHYPFRLALFLTSLFVFAHRTQGRVLATPTKGQEEGPLYQDRYV
jgi:hypothetical protein